MGTPFSKGHPFLTAEGNPNSENSNLNLYSSSAGLEKCCSNILKLLKMILNRNT